MFLSICTLYYLDLQMKYVTDSCNKHVDFAHFAPSPIIRCVRELALLKQAPTSEAILTK